MKKELETAILFEAYYIKGQPYQFFIPKRVLIGEADEKKMKFYDHFSQKIYYNSDLAMADEKIESFYFVKKLTNLKKEFQLSDTDDITEVAKKYFEEIRKQVYYFDDDECIVLKYETREDFYERTGITITYGYVEDDSKKFEDREIETNEISMDNEVVLPSIVDVYNQITKNVLCQDKQVKKILTAIYKNLCFPDSNIKSNIFIIGPTGVGKTAILKQVSKLLEIPMVIEDSTRYTVNGYAGCDIEDSLRNLYNNAHGDLELAQRGILVFDEIDKKVSSTKESSAVYEGMTEALLTIMEGSVINIQLDKVTKTTIPFDTTNLTVIVSGAFSKMKDVLGENKRSLGFNGVIAPKTDVIREYNVEDFIKFGFSPEFMGRFSTFIPLNSLTRENIKDILLYSESSPLVAHRSILEDIDISLDMKNQLIDLIVDRAYNMNTGARGLKKIVDNVFENIFFDLFADNTNIKKIKITPEVLNNSETGYQIVKRREKNIKIVQ